MRGGSVLWRVLVFVGTFQGCSTLSCTSGTNFTCAKTLYVTGTCDHDTNVCECVSGFEPIPTGCGTIPESSPETRPTISAGEFGELSGWVYSTGTSSMSLKCSSPFAVVGGEYAWYLENQEVEGSTGSTIEVENIPDGATLSYRCSVSSAATIISEPFVIQAYKEGDTIQSQPVLEGMSTWHFAFASISIRCVNVPKDDTLSYSFNGAPAVSSATKNILLPPQASKTSYCTVSTSRNDITFADARSEDVTSSPIDSDDLSIPVTIAEGSSMTVVRGSSSVSTLSCVTTNIAYADEDQDQFEYTWRRNGEILDTTSSDDPSVYTFSIASSDTDGNFQITCSMNVIGSSSVVESEPITIIPVDSELQIYEVDIVNIYPLAPLEGYTELKCLYYSFEDIGNDAAYEWTFDGDLIVGHTDSSLQLNNLASDMNGEYTCKVKPTSSGPVESRAFALNARTLTIPPMITPFFGVTFVVGKEYSVTCFNVAETPGMTYSWQLTTDSDGILLEGSTNTAEFTAPTADALLTCRSTIGATTTTAGYDIKPQYIATPSITGPSKPVIGTPVTYMCNVDISQEATDVAYAWKANGDSLPDEYTSTLTMDPISAAQHQKDYECEVSGSSEVRTSSSKALSPVVNPEKPTIETDSGSDIFRKGGKYKLVCTSDSSTQGPTYAWQFKASTAGSTKQSLPTTGCTLSFDSTNRDNAGDYWCTITIDGKVSSESEAKTVTYEDTQGKSCSSVSDCTPQNDRTWPSFYTGNCVAGSCQCASGVPLSADQCGEPESDPDTDSSSDDCSVDNAGVPLGSDTIIYVLALFASFLCSKHALFCTK